MQDDPEYLAKNRMRLLTGSAEDAQELDANSVNWSDSEEVSKIHVRQDPARRERPRAHQIHFPNEFDVYLHDTPADTSSRPRTAASATAACA